MGRGGRGGFRRGEGAFRAERKGRPHVEWLYGRRPVAEALRAGRREFIELRVSASARDDGAEEEFSEIEELAREAGIRPLDDTRSGITSLLGDVNHQGVALKCSPYRYTPFNELLDIAGDEPGATLLFLDHIEDPQNLGSLLRSSDASGVSGVVIPEDRAAEVTPAAVRASAGAAEHVNVAKVVNLPRAIDEARERGFWMTGLDFAEDARYYDSIDYSGRVGIVVGNEGRGLSRLVREKCDFIAMLPMLGGVSSLNAAVAGAIALYEVLRQRRSAAGK